MVLVLVFLRTEQGDMGCVLATGRSGGLVPAVGVVVGVVKKEL